MARIRVDGARSYLGEKYVQEAKTRLTTALLQEANIAIEHLTSEDVVPMLFEPEVISLLEAAFRHAKPTGSYGIYDLGRGVTIRLQVGDMLVPNSRRDVLHNADRLTAAVTTALALQEKWAKVSCVLDWCDRITPGAARALWPPILELCGKSPALRKYVDVPNRYSAPADLVNYLPLLRETSATVATLALMPNGVTARPFTGVNINLSRALSATDNYVSFTIAPTTINL